MLTTRPDLELEVPKGAAAVTHTVVSCRGADHSVREDDLAVEEPLEIRLGGRSLAVTMRTPGHDDELVAGFLLAEQVIAGPDDLDVVAHYAGPEDDPRIGNIINVLLKHPASATQRRLERNFFTSSACGLCGKATLDAIDVELPPVAGQIAIPLDVFYGLEPALAAAQATFGRTGGLHAAALFDPTG